MGAMGKACALVWLCLSLTGCGSIIYNGNLKIEPYEPETVPPVWDEPDYEPEIMQLEEDGKPAFYILEGHEPDPAQMEGFKLLDLIDGTTTVYAYTTPYRGTEESGLPGGKTTGKAIFEKAAVQDKESLKDKEIHTGENAKEEGESETKEAEGKAKEAEEAQPMVTVLMAYQTDTETYQVFYCKVTKPGSGEGNPSDLANMLSAQTETGITANKVGDDYFLYHAGIGYVFSKDGTEISEQNLTEVLNENIHRYQAGNRNSVTISDVIMDIDQRIYVPMVIEDASLALKKNQAGNRNSVKNIDQRIYDPMVKEDVNLALNEDFSEDLTEEDLAGEDGKLRKVICCCFYLNAGKDNQPPVFFRSLNENAEKQESLWCESAEEGEDRLTMEQVKEYFPDHFSEFYLNQALALQLCGFSLKRNQLIIWFFDRREETPTALEPYNAEDYAAPNSVVMAYNSNIKKYYYIKNQRDRKINYSDFSDSSLHYLNILLSYGSSGDWFDSMEPVKKTIVRTYTTEESETDEDGTVTETTVEHEEEAQITVEYRLHMKEGTELFSSVDWWTSNITAPGASGLIHYGTKEEEIETEEEDENKEIEEKEWLKEYVMIEGEAESEETKEEEKKKMKQTSFFTYSFSAQNGGNASSSGSGYEPQKQITGGDVPGYAVSAGSIELPDGGECLALFTSKGIALLEIQTGQGNRLWERKQYFIPYSKLDFRKNAGGNFDHYSAHSLSFDGKMMMVFSLYNGIVMLQLDTMEAVQLDTGAYYAAFLQPSGGCAAIGFRDPRNASNCTLADLPKARIYSIVLDTEEAALQIVKSRLGRDPELRDAIAEGRKGDELIEKWRLTAHRKEISAYFASLREAKRRRDQGVREFFRLTGLRESQEITAELLNCSYPSSVEELIAKYIAKSSEDPAQGQIKIQNQYEILSELKRRRGLSDQEWDARIQSIITQIQASAD